MKRTYTLRTCAAVAALFFAAGPAFGSDQHPSNLGGAELPEDSVQTPEDEPSTTFQGSDEGWLKGQPRPRQVLRVASAAALVVALALLFGRLLVAPRLSPLPPQPYEGLPEVSAGNTCSRSSAQVPHVFAHVSTPCG